MYHRTIHGRIVLSCVKSLKKTVGLFVAHAWQEEYLL
jgi:hypothetical protein